MVGFYENKYGEQLVFLREPGGEPMTYHGDSGWDPRPSGNRGSNPRSGTLPKGLCKAKNPGCPGIFSYPGRQPLGNTRFRGPTRIVAVRRPQSPFGVAATATVAVPTATRVGRRCVAVARFG